MKSRAKTKQKAAPKPKVNKQQQNADQLLARIKDEQAFLREQKLEKRFGGTLDALEATIQTLSMAKNNLAILQRVEKELGIVKAQVDRALKRKRLKYGLILNPLLTLKVLIFMGTYFTYIPKTSFAKHPTIYITVAGILLAVWIAYFALLNKSHTIFHRTYVIPYSLQRPEHTQSIQRLSVNIFHLVSFTPLFTAVNLFPRIIDPNWDTILVQMGALIVDLFTSNKLTAIVNILAFLPLILLIVKGIKKLFKSKNA